MDPSPSRFEELLRSSARLVRAAIARAAGRSSTWLLDDVEQEVYLALWRRFTSADGPPEEISPAYLYRAAVRETVRALARLPAPSADAAEAAVEAGDPASDPARRLASRELGERIVAALARLTPDRRRAVLADLQGYEVAEIMRLFGWGYQRARNLVARGTADLRRRLAEERGARRERA